VKWAVPFAALLGLSIGCRVGPAVAGQKVELVWWHVEEVREPFKAAVKWAISEYEKANPNVSMKVEITGYGANDAKIKAAAAAHQTPDIGMIAYGGAIYRYASMGILEPITDVVKEVGVEDYWPGSMREVTYKGEIYGLPDQANSDMLFYRKDLLAEKGVTPPQTWDELLKSAKQLTGGGHYGIAYGLGSTDGNKIIWDFMRTNNASVFDKNLKVVFDTAETREALQMLKDLAPYTPPGTINMSTTDGRVNALRGTVPMVITSTSFPYEILTKAPTQLAQFGAVPLPKKSQRGCYYFSGALFLFKDSPHKKEVKDFFRFLHRRDIYSQYLATMPNGFQPQRRSTFKDPVYLNDARVKQVAQFLDAGAESLQACSTPGNDQVMNPYGSEIESRLILKKVVDLVLVDGKSPAEAAATGQKWIEQLVEEIGK
jgi:multiple sugar transport system substrate-binding protein